MTEQGERSQYPRFSSTQRFEHLLLLVAVLGLALTGLPQLFSGESWARFLIRALGGIESVRLLHRFLASLLVVEVIYHIGRVCYQLWVLRRPATMLPTRRDLLDLSESILHSLGRRRDLPRMPRYNFRNKLEYLLVAVSLIILLITGFMLWNPVATTAALPGDTIPAARVVHGNQALLLILIVTVWHLYNVLIRRFNLSMFTGKLSRRALLEEHGEELDALEQGVVFVSPLSVETITRRKRLFWPVAAILTLLLAGGLVWLVTFEQTAITTVPRQSAVIYAPNASLQAGDPHVGAALWSTLRCAFCHGPQAGGGTAPALVNTDLTFDQFYQQIRKGSDKMTAFQPTELPDAYISHLWAWLNATSTF